MSSYPENYCRCHPLSRRGGDSCQKVFCLNECSGAGDCDNKTGLCKCKENRFGEDCSVRDIVLELVDA